MRIELIQISRKITFLISAIFLLNVNFLIAQSAPHLINYQGIARDSGGMPLVSASIALKFEIRQGSITGAAVFTETQSVQTSPLGLFSTQIGKISSLAGINWKNTPYFLFVAMDPNGAGFVDMGAQQLAHVPYALHAEDVPSTYSNNVLTIGNTSHTLAGNASTYVAGPGISINGSTISANATNLNLTPGTNMSVTGTYPDYTVAATPTLGLNGTSISISGGNSVDITQSVTLNNNVLNVGPATNTVDITQPVTFTNNVLTVGPGTNSVLIPGSQAPVITGLNAATVTPLGTNFTVDVATPSVTGTGATSVSGTYPGFTVHTASVTVGATGASSISGGYPNYTVHTPSVTVGATGASSISGAYPNYTVHTPSVTVGATGASSISGAYPNYTVHTPSVTVGASGASTLAGAYPNYTVHTPSVTVGATGASSISGSYPNYTVHTPSVTVGATGAATMSGTWPNYTVNSYTPNITGLGSATVINAFPNYTIATPVPPSPTVIGTGLAAVSPSSGINFTVDVPVPVYTPSTGGLAFGSTVVPVVPSLSLSSGNVLTSGPASNSVSFGNAFWGMQGNAGTTPSVNFIGTTDNQPLVFRVNNQYAGMITPLQDVYIGYRAGATGSASANFGNVAIGSEALYLSNGGYGNTAVGQSALRNNVTGIGNVAIGQMAMVSGTNVAMNVAIGQEALKNYSNGLYNVAVGSEALKNSISGKSNIAMGSKSSFSNTTGHQNIAIGMSALYSNQTAGRNIAFGDSSLYNSTSGTNNTAIGVKSLFNNTTGFENVGIGNAVLYANTTGSMNTATGNQALYSNTTGSGNAAFGRRALFANTTGIYNTALGFGALEDNTSGTNNAATGWLSLANNTAGHYNAGYGHQSLFNNTTGDANTAIGMQAGMNNTTGGNVTAVGFAASYSNTTGHSNVALGQRALYSNQTISHLVAVGDSALYANSTGVRNVAIGSKGLALNTSGSGNTALGHLSQSSNSSGSINTSIGDQSMSNNTTGSSNVGVGYRTLFGNSTGQRNTALGTNALFNTQSGTNTAVGYEAGFSNSTGTGNVFLGNQAGYNETGSDKLYVANNATTTLIYGNFAAKRVGINTTSPAAAFEVNGTTLLDSSFIVRGTATPTVSAAGQGRIYYDASTNKFKVSQNGAAYVDLISGSAGWSTTGNAGTSPTVNFIGTTDNQALAFRVNSQHAGKIDHNLLNIFLGHQAGPSTTTGSNNVAVGSYAMYVNTTGVNNTALGMNSLYMNSSGQHNSASGNYAMYSNTTGSLNTASGSGAMGNSTTGNQNVASGYATLYNNTTGHFNAAYGAAALYSNQSGWYNTAIGHQAGFSAAHQSGNVFIGANAGYYETGSNKLYIANSNTTVSPLFYGDFSTGRVSINTTSTLAALTVDNQSVTTRSGFMVRNGRDEIGSGMPVTIEGVTSGQTYGSTTHGRLLRLINTTQNNFYDMGIHSNGSFYIAENNGYAPAAVNISTVGYVGLGTSTPSTMLEVNGNISLPHSSKLIFGTQAGTGEWIANSGLYGLGLYTNSTERIRITGGGTVGIGTSTPGTFLHAYNSTGDAIVRVETPTSSNEARMEFVKFGGTFSASVGFYPGNASLRLRTMSSAAVVFEPNSVERMRVEDNGRVGIGTAAPTRTLHVQGNVRIVDGTEGLNKVLTSDANGNASWTTVGTSSANICILKDEKSTSNTGGTFTSGSWVTRDLNVVEGNSSLVSLAGNQFTLQAGTYYIQAVAPAYGVNRHQAKLRNITDNSDEIMGKSSYCPTTIENDSQIFGTITITSAKVFEIQHRCTVTVNANGFGVDGTFGPNEVFTQVLIMKLN